MWIILGLALLAVFLLVRSDIRNKKLLLSVTKQNRGTRTERDLVLSLLKHGIPAQTIFHDLYIKKQHGGFSQIDLVVATKAGIIVIEVKDYSGWIFGSGHQSQWTQVLAYGKRKFRLYNPVLQNSNHISELKKQLPQFEKIPFYSIIVFYGSCELKDINGIPNDTFLVKPDRMLELMDTVMNDKPLAPYTNKQEIVRLLAAAVQNGDDKEIQALHVKHILEMLNQNRKAD